MINRCMHFKKLISRYVDNDLDVQERQIVESHVASCLKCHKVMVSYMAIRKLVSESYAVALKGNRHAAQYRTHTTHVLHFPMWNVGMKLAASIILVVSIFAGISFYSFSKRSQSLPLVLERESQSLLNTPLCAIVYYEVISGNAIHSQYASIQDNTVSSYTSSTGNVNNSFYYESPLFYDNSFVKQKYEAITSIASTR